MEEPKIGVEYIHAMAIYFTWASKELKNMNLPKDKQTDNLE